MRKWVLTILLSLFLLVQAATVMAGDLPPGSGPGPTPSSAVTSSR